VIATVACLLRLRLWKRQWLFILTCSSLVHAVSTR